MTAPKPKTPKAADSTWDPDTWFSGKDKLDVSDGARAHDAYLAELWTRRRERLGRGGNPIDLADAFATFGGDDNG